MGGTLNETTDAIYYSVYNLVGKMDKWGYGRRFVGGSIPRIIYLDLKDL